MAAVHELHNLAKHQTPRVGCADSLLDGTEDRLLSVLVVHCDAAAGGSSGGDDAVGFFDRGNEWLLADHVSPALKRADADLRMRVRRRTDDNDVRSCGLEQLLECRERRRSGPLRPRGPLLIDAVSSPDELGSGHGSESGLVEGAGGPAEADETEAHRRGA